MSDKIDENEVKKWYDDNKSNKDILEKIADEKTVFQTTGDTCIFPRLWVGKQKEEEKNKIYMTYCGLQKHADKGTCTFHTKLVAHIKDSLENETWQQAPPVWLQNKNKTIQWKDVSNDEFKDVDTDDLANRLFQYVPRQHQAIMKKIQELATNKEKIAKLTEQIEKLKEEKNELQNTCASGQGKNEQLHKDLEKKETKIQNMTQQLRVLTSFLGADMDIGDDEEKS